MKHEVTFLLNGMVETVSGLSPTTTLAAISAPPKAAHRHQGRLRRRRLRRVHGDVGELRRRRRHAGPLPGGQCLHPVLADAGRQAADTVEASTAALGRGADHPVQRPWSSITRRSAVSARRVSSCPCMQRIASRRGAGPSGSERSAGRQPVPLYRLRADRATPRALPHSETDRPSGGAPASSRKPSADCFGGDPRAGKPRTTAISRRQR